MTKRHILVGVDGSTGARAAIAWAATYARSIDGPVLAVHVLTYSRELVQDLPPVGFTTWRQRLGDALRGPWTEPLRHIGVTHECLLREDDNVDRGLPAVADDRPALCVTS